MLTLSDTKIWQHKSHLFLHPDDTVGFILSKFTFRHTVSLSVHTDRKAMKNLDSTLKAKALLCWKNLYSQGYGLSSSHVWLWELDHKGREPNNWNFGIAILWNSSTLELWCWRGVLRVPWTGSRSNQSILKEIHPEYSLEVLILKFQYFDHLMWTADSLEKTLMLGKIEGRKRRGWQRIRWLDGITDSWTWTGADSGGWWGATNPGVLQSMGPQRAGHT